MRIELSKNYTITQFCSQIHEHAICRKTPGNVCPWMTEEASSLESEYETCDKCRKVSLLQYESNNHLYELTDNSSDETDSSNQIKI
jgi:hypothetical protein